MQLKVTEKVNNNLTNKSAELDSFFKFENGKTFGKLNYGTVFQARLDNHSAIVSLVRQLDDKTLEVYDEKEVHALNGALFEQETSDHTIVISFNLIK